jgi:hypothetical protein
MTGIVNAFQLLINWQQRSQSELAISTNSDQ